MKLLDISSVHLPTIRQNIRTTALTSILNTVGTSLWKLCESCQKSLGSGFFFEKFAVNQIMAISLDLQIERETFPKIFHKFSKSHGKFLVKFRFIWSKAFPKVADAFNFNYNIPSACLLNRSPVPAMDLKSNRSGLWRHMLETCRRLRRLCRKRSNNVARHDKTPVKSTLLSRDKNILLRDRSLMSRRSDIMLWLLHI